MPPPPSPASSTCSDTTLPSTSQKRPKKHPTTREKEENNEEDWALRDVIFVEDSKTVPIGHVLKVDGSYALVHFKSGPQQQGQDRAVGREEDMAALIDESRLLRLDELQVLKNGSLPKAPDCLQKTPKRVPLPDFASILSLCADAGGVQAVIREGKKISYKSFSLHSGRVEKESRFPIEMTSFLGLDPSLVSLHSGGTGDVEQMNVLRDGNGTLFPLVKDALETLKDPILLDLPPVKCLGLGVHALPHVGATQKNQVGVLVLALEQQVLMGKILRCEVEEIRTVVAALDADFGNRSGGMTLNRILLERADGNRNCFHVSATMAAPSQNSSLSTTLPSPLLPTTTNTTTATPTQPITVAAALEGIRKSFSGGASAESEENAVGFVPVQASSIPLLDLEDSNDELDSAHALNMGYKAFGSQPTSQGSNNLSSPSSPSVWDPNERIRNSQQGLKLLLGSAALEPHLHQFLGER